MSNMPTLLRGPRNGSTIPERLQPSWLEIQAGLFSIAAAAIHFLAMPGHYEEWWGYGAFFLAVGLAQGFYGVGLLVPGRSYFRTRGYLLVGVLGNLLVIWLYIVTRTLGVPFFGPEAGEVEQVGVSDITADGDTAPVTRSKDVSRYQKSQV